MVEHTPDSTIRVGGEGSRGTSLHIGVKDGLHIPGKVEGDINSSQAHKCVHGLTKEVMLL